MGGEISVYFTCAALIFNIPSKATEILASCAKPPQSREAADHNSPATEAAALGNVPDHSPKSLKGGLTCGLALGSEKGDYLMGVLELFSM